jgi:riboflavin kinase/FMN adenylyltransferase
MQIFTTWRALPAAARHASVALGNFDGVHLGHAHVIRAAHAARPDAPLAVLSFEPHPRQLFRPDDPPFRLTLSAERAAALATLGVAILYELNFDREFSLMSADMFVQDVLHEALGARHLVCGPDFAFGHRRGGDVGLLGQRAEALGIGFTAVTPLDDSGGTISATRRTAIPSAPPASSAAPGRSAAWWRTARSAGAPSASRPPTSPSASIWNRRAASMRCASPCPAARW